MTDFVNVFESSFFDGRFIDARGSYVLSTYSTSSGTAELFYSNDNGETISNIAVPTSRNTHCRISLDGQYMFIYSSIYQTFYKSSDGGITWNAHFSSLGGGTWMQISDTGQHYMWCPNGGQMRISNDYGETFTTIASLKAMRGDINSTGQYMCSLHKLNADLYVNVSNDYGATWTEQILNIGGSSTSDVSVSISKTGQYMLLMSSGSNFRVSSNYGVSFQEITNTNQQWKHCEISYLNPQYMYAMIQSQTNTIWASEDYGQSWSAVYNHPYSVNYDNLASTDNYLFAFNRGRARLDRYTLTHSAPSGSGGGESGGGESGGGETPAPSTTIYFDTAPIVKRFSSAITDASNISFSLPLPSDLKHYKITLLNESAVNNYPAFVGDMWFSSTEQVVVPLVSQKILSQSVSDNVLTFTLDANYSGTFTLSVMRSS